MCKSNYVQKMTFDSYLYKAVVPGNPLDDVKLLLGTVSSLLRSNALRRWARPGGGCAEGGRGEGGRAPAGGGRRW